MEDKLKKKKLSERTDESSECRRLTPVQSTHQNVGAINEEIFTFEKFYSTDCWLPREQTTTRHNKSDPKSMQEISFTASIGEKPVGIILGYADDADKESLYIERIEVAASHRNKKIGTQLLRRIEEVAKENNYTKLSLQVEKRNNAINLYKREGFKLKISTSVQFQRMEKEIV